jgi:hypothetical protein
MKISSLAMPAALLVYCLIACNGHRDSSMASRDAKAEDMQTFAADSTSAGRKPDPKSPQAMRQIRPTSASPQANPDWDKKIVKTADIGLEVKNFRVFNAALSGIVKQFGGYISQEQETQSSYKIENTMTIKVPVEQFEGAMNRLSAGSDSDKLVGKKISTEDVTMEVVDTKSRMESKKEVLQRYLELLKQAKTMNEILKV